MLWATQPCLQMTGVLALQEGTYKAVRLGLLNTRGLLRKQADLQSLMRRHRMQALACTPTTSYLNKFKYRG